jgi:hypothetical protein
LTTTTEEGSGGGSREMKDFFTSLQYSPPFLLASSLGIRGTKWFGAQLLELLVAVFE